MQQAIAVIFYDGVISKPHQAQLIVMDAAHFEIHYLVDGRKVSQRFERTQMSFLGAIGRNFPAIELENDARIEFLSHDIPEVFNLKRQALQKKIWSLERSPVLILLSIVIVVGGLFAMTRWGVPLAAYHIAMKLPETALQEVGKSSEQYILELTRPTQLSAQRQAQLKQTYLKLIGQEQPAKLIFRQGQSLSANALALPNNTIIVTDELVALAKDDQEIVGVLAHEQGHLKHRHSLQQAIANVGMSIIIMSISGDVSDLLSGLPIAVAGAKFSRDFEEDADLYALQQMQQKNIDVNHFANMLERLEHASKREDADTVSQLLSTHPVTDDRIRHVREFKASSKL